MSITLDLLRAYGGTTTPPRATSEAFEMDLQEFEDEQKAEDTPFYESAGTFVTEAVPQVAGGFIDALNEYGTLFNAIAGTDIELPTETGRLPTVDPAETAGGAFLRGGAQFLTGFIPAFRALKGIGVTNSFIRASAASGLSDFASFGANDPRVSNFIESYPEFNNIITEFLAAPEDRSDGEFEGRFKNFLEGAGLGLAFEGVFKGARLLRAGAQNTRKAFEGDTIRPIEDFIDDTPPSKEQPTPTEEPQQDVGPDLPERGPLGEPKPEQLALEAPKPSPKERPNVVPEEPVISGNLSETTKQLLRETEIDFDKVDWKKDLKINWNAVTDEDNLRKVYSGINRAFKDVMDVGVESLGVEGGKQTNRTTFNKAEAEKAKLANNLGTTIGRANRIFSNMKDLTTNVTLFNLIVEDSADHLYRLTDAIANNKILDEFATRVGPDGTKVPNPDAYTDQLMAKQRHQAVHTMLYSQNRATRSELGRALQALKITERSRVAMDFHYGQFIDSHGGMGSIQKRALQEKKMMDAAEKKNGKAGRRKAATKVAQGWGSKTKNAFLQVYINGILSGFDSAVANSIGSALVVGNNVIERKIAELLPGSGVQKGETLAMMKGLKQQPMDILKLAWQALRTGDSSGRFVRGELKHPNVITGENFGLDGVLGSTVDVFGNITRIPTNIMLSSDEVFRGLGYQMERSAKAHRIALEADPSKGAEYIEQYRRIMEMSPEDLRVSDDPSFAEVDMVAALEGAKTVFATPIQNRLLQGFDQIRQNFPFGLGQIYIPFYSTVLNIFKYTLERTPGANFLVNRVGLSESGRVQAYSMKDDLLGRNGERARQMAWAKTLYGTTLYAAGYSMAESGWITGAPPEDLGQRTNYFEKGATPYSLVTQINGKDVYVPFSRLDPLGTILALAADIQNIAVLVNDPRLMSPEESENANSHLEDIAGTVLYQTREMLEDKAMLKGFGDLVSMFSGDPMRQKNALKTLITTSPLNPLSPMFTFYSGLRGDIARGTDPVVRNSRHAEVIDEIWNDFMKRNPMLNKKLFPRLNYLGEPVLNDIYGEFSTSGRGMRLVQNLFVPTPPRPKQKSKLINKIVELNVRATPPSRWRSISVRGKLGSETIPLSMEQQYFWAKEAGKLNKTMLEKEVGKKWFNNMPDGIQSTFLSNALAKNRSIAKQLLLAEYPELRQQMMNFKLQDIQSLSDPIQMNPAYLR